MANIVAVSALNAYVKSILESDGNLANIAVQGEISNFNCHFKTGHCYFTLKDEKAGVKAVMFRTNAQGLAFTPQNGMRVLARGRVSLFERDGSFQLYVQHLFPDGEGSLQMAFEQLKQRLNQEGLFSEEAKKPLPSQPRCVGLVTSKTGAALQDILKVAARRCPTARFILAPASVQGEKAEAEIVEAIRRLDQSGKADVIIVARGGGSAEDLWVFNSEAIARAVYACKTPVISAIGHEIDFTILDFVADMRAPTPSAAAEIALPDIQQTVYTLHNVYAKIANIMRQKLNSCYNRYHVARRHPAMLAVERRPAREAALLRQKTAALGKSQAVILNRATARLGHAAQMAAGLNPYAVLGRGYSVLTQNGKPVRSVYQVQTGARVHARLANGNLQCTVDTIEPLEEANATKKTTQL